jgi:hypothetical protein
MARQTPMKAKAAYKATHNLSSRAGRAQTAFGLWCKARSIRRRSCGGSTLPWSPDDSASVLEASFARTGDNGELVQEAKKMGVKPKKHDFQGQWWWQRD